jgi:hypothetical protein
MVANPVTIRATLIAVRYREGRDFIANRPSTAKIRPKAKQQLALVIGPGTDCISSVKTPTAIQAMAKPKLRLSPCFRDSASLFAGDFMKFYPLWSPPTASSATTSAYALILPHPQVADFS